MTASKIVRRKPKKQTLVGDKVQAFILRIRIDERDALFKDAERQLRTINLHALYCLTRFLNCDKKDSLASEVLSFNEELLGQEIEKLTVRIPLELHQKCMSYAVDIGASFNAVLRYALLKAGPGPG